MFASSKKLFVIIMMREERKFIADQGMTFYFYEMTSIKNDV
ncbi:hypothetical protein B4168_3402 [Anoxybacillus flavithermus]|nr:hypothetical protein B4168_3402 [Anoxybacillus flavithermus]OAO85026.1 hypothetical protein GT23_3080 [Parageobacillus thermoglucosidasius]